MSKSLEYYMSLNYKVEIEFIEDENMWIAFHPELGRGTCYAEADSREKAIQSLDEDRYELFKLLLEDGVEIKEPVKEEDSPSGQLLLRIPKSMHKTIKEYAANEGISANQWLVTAISGKLGERRAILSFQKYFIDNLMIYQAKTSQYNALFKKGLHSTWATLEMPESRRTKILPYKASREEIYE